MDYSNPNFQLSTINFQLFFVSLQFGCFAPLWPQGIVYMCVIK